ncbi:MAG: sulfatase-like hydrolase/transferase [Planctomycetota bacterium]
MFLIKKLYFSIFLIKILFCSFISIPASAEELSRPNIIFILADDLGWGDFSIYGHPEMNTPNIDGLAKKGKLFTQFYVNSGVCSPSRVSFTTGHFPSRHGVHGHFSSPQENQARNMPNWLDTSVATVAGQLKSAGYATAHFGKWHMCMIPSEDAPSLEEYGFDKSYGYLAPGAQLPIETTNNPYFRAQSTKTIIDETLRFLKDNPDKPCYINAWTLIPHTILNPTPSQMEPFLKYAPKIKGKTHLGAKVVYYSTLNDFDEQIGRLVEGLEALNIADNTLVIITSDNGPEDVMLDHNGAAHEGIGSVGPFRGRKRSLYEGGIRVPLIVKWPKKIEQGVVDNDTVISAIDFMPTLCAIAGADIPKGQYPIDGENMIEAFLNNSIKRKKPLVWQYPFEIKFGHILDKSPAMAIRDGDWKLLINPSGNRAELFNIVEDPSELNNLAHQNSSIVEEMSGKLKGIIDNMPQSFISDKAGDNSYSWPKGK